jgi:hypothetical protein
LNPYMTTCPIDDDQHLKPISSPVSDLTLERESLILRMKEIIQFFLDLLQVSGGDIAP